MKYYAKLDNYYINVLGLFTTPFRLRDTLKDRDSICYTEDECKMLKRVYPKIKFETFKLYSRQSYATRNKRTDK